MNEPVYLGQWIWFRDANGFGFAQPDAFVLGQEILLFECKLSYRESAWNQLRGLYAPLLAAIFNRQIRCVQVTKFVGADVPVSTSFPPPDGYVFHWLDY